MKPWIVLMLFPMLTFAQDFKEEISIVQFSAPFTKEAEVSLKSFKQHNTYTFSIIEKKEVFDEEKIKYLPTIILYHNGDEVIRVESGISLKLPENTIELIEKEIEEIIESKF
tara:strand:+ start:319 stop:654 length:336 start_codon:yes stop_codon:yes gene_type:complete